MSGLFIGKASGANRSIQKTAAQYVARLYSGEMTAGEEGALQNWLRANPAHKAEFEVQLAVSDAYVADADSFRVPEFEEAGSAKVWGSLIAKWGMPRFVGACAAVAIMLMVAVSSLWQTDPLRQFEAQYATAVGEQRTVKLPDGSVITLNTNTVLDVDFTGPDRTVSLSQGEAYFDIAKDKARVFTVHAGSQTVTVLGTKFNIQKRGQEYTVAVLEGLVAVHPKGKLLDTPVLEPAAQGSEITELAGQYRLKAGHVMTYKDKTDLVATARVEDTSQYSQWSSGIVTFNEAALSDVVAELGRYTHKKIMIVDRDVETMKVSGVFHLRELDEVVLGLEQAFELQVILHEDAILISGS